MFLICKVVFYHENQIVCFCVPVLTAQSLLWIGRFPGAGWDFVGRKHRWMLWGASRCGLGGLPPFPIPGCRLAQGKSGMSIKVMRGVGRRVSGGTTANCSFFKCPLSRLPPHPLQVTVKHCGHCYLPTLVNTHKGQKRLPWKRSKQNRNHISQDAAGRNKLC